MQTVAPSQTFWIKICLNKYPGVHSYSNLTGTALNYERELLGICLYSTPEVENMLFYHLTKPLLWLELCPPKKIHWILTPLFPVPIRWPICLLLCKEILKGGQIWSGGLWREWWTYSEGWQVLKQGPHWCQDGFCKETERTLFWVCSKMGITDSLLFWQ